MAHELIMFDIATKADLNALESLRDVAENDSSQAWMRGGQIMMVTSRALGGKLNVARAAQRRKQQEAFANEERKHRLSQTESIPNQSVSI